ncbi:MAG: hypothetical protein J07HN6_00798 [Halonotius sp. J07HN6]|jgi:hypothetical protein|nr:MAG: hypothetical protein J07HN6_00798 [Halonotius sp. J07HN6]ESS10084.1 MAG: hypothetical protein A07HN63_00146 [uncultured archaeon A07HN63]
MSGEAQPPEAAQPPRDDALPESYALRVTDGEVRVWQYNPTIADPEGEWQYVEIIAQENAPRFTLDYATLDAPDGDGYWLYSKSYDCAMDCE